MNKKFSTVTILAIFLSAVLSVAAVVPRNTGTVKPNPAISRAIQKYSDRESKGLGKITILKSDVQGNWALVLCRAAKKDVDDAQYLLQRVKGEWKVLVMGTSLVGTGEEFKVPPALIKKWDL
jgi:hypothetical protein